jgi:hypothetical protein
VQDGFLLSGEVRSWRQTLCFTQTTQLPHLYLASLARMTLMLP